MQGSLQDLHVLILGLGHSGLAMARWCARQGARVTVADTREEPPQRATLLADIPGVRLVVGPLDASMVDDPSLRAVYRSPGLVPARIAALLQAARERAIPVSGELGLYTQALQRLRETQGYAPTLLAVTGTNGKTTVTALTGQLIARAGRSVAVAGNIGPSLLDTLQERLDATALPEVWVLELSSFQLDAVDAFEPTAATVLNLTQDHLDWHGDMAAYSAAKARIFGEHAVMVLNRDDPLVAAMRPPASPPRSGRGPRPVPRRVLTFGAGAPEAAGDFGIESVAGMPWLVRAQDADDTQRRRKDTAPEELHLQRLMPVGALRIRGRHNALNALAALALAHAAGCALAPLLYALREYRGEPHRVESIGVLNSIEFFDDSKGTNVGATVAALQGLGAEQHVVAILGGDGKGQDFAPLAEPVARFARAVVLIGRDGPRIGQALAKTEVPLLAASTLAQAVALAHAQAQPGDAVLLSPACASFDMFRDYAERADVFRTAVHELARARGAELEFAA